MLNAIIVDDEPASHGVLIDILKRVKPQVKVLGSAFKVSEGIELINRCSPDLLFLDIEMPDGTGFDLLKQINRPSFSVIFITAFNQFAQTAIRFGALDYLVKPVDKIELMAALERAQSRNLEFVQLRQLEILNETLSLLKAQKLPQKISIATSEGILYIKVKEIIRLKAMQNFTEFFLKNRSSRLIASLNMKKFEDAFKPYDSFLRIHKSHLVNLLEVERFIKGEKAYVEMSDGEILPVSKGNKLRVLSILEKL